ncbi:divalent-cation tolerance protein CutA [Candidatus Woesearchaeota archaeon]|nr:hypothetical protein [uncultured archaeon]AQS32312.1 hypothetical protein [uncultured archaeon]MBS3149427.1 divalent-cation tolerance protein CutA [Candidatus Woesearchaeota archaeon]
MLIVYVTCHNRDEARSLAKGLVEKKIAGYVNYVPISSFYWWKKEVIHDREFALIIQSAKNNFKEIEKYVKEHHSYERPAIISLNVDDVTPIFLKWLNDIQK